jgi:hypothetical protein
MPIQMGEGLDQPLLVALFSGGVWGFSHGEKSLDTRVPPSAMQLAVSAFPRSPRIH